MDRFEDLNAFVTVAETGSFTAAAERLRIAKSAISRRVAQLEERLGVQLIHRTTRRLSLTDSGAAFYERGVRVLADLDEAESAVAQAHGELRGMLRIALPLSFGRRHMGEPICEFSREHPRIEFDLDFNDRRVDLIEDGVDLAIRISRLKDTSLIARRLFQVHTVVCASPAYLAQFGAPERPEDLADHACLVYSNLAEPRLWRYRDANGVAHDVRVSAAMSATSGDFLCEVAVDGRGIVLQPDFIAHEYIADGRLVPLLANYRWPVTPAYAVYPPTRHLNYRVRAFIDFIAARFAERRPWAIPLVGAGRSA